MLLIRQLTFIYIFSYIFLKAPIWLHPFTVPLMIHPLSALLTVFSQIYVSSL